MAPMYDKPVRLLMKDFVKEIDLKPGEILQRDTVFQWFKQHYPKIKESTVQAHLSKMSINLPVRIHYKANPNGEDDLFFRINPNQYRLYAPQSDPTPIYKEGGVSIHGEVASDDAISEECGSEFAYERDLRNYLSKNLTKIEPGLQLYEEEGITGIEFPVGGRYIDILALDKQNNYVVIELKVSRGYDRVIGQLLRYMGWVQKHQADAGQGVRGLIIAKEITEDLILATSKIKDVDLFEYELALSLKKVAVY